MKNLVLVVIIAFVFGIVSMLSFSVPVEATSNLWRCVNCGGQTQSSSSDMPSPGTCPHSKSGHSWRLVR